jgi:precorrin-4/cobalt-precorrin-4 C11-methyltransferase
VHRIDEVVAQLKGVYGPDCPAAVVGHVSHPHEVVLRGRLDSIPAAVHEAGIRMAAVVIVGPALAAEHFPDSHLYSDARCRS